MRAGAWEKQRATFDSQCINLLWRPSQVLISEGWRAGVERTNRMGSLLAKSGRSRKKLQQTGWVVLQGRSAHTLTVYEAIPCGDGRPPGSLDRSANNNKFLDAYTPSEEAEGVMLEQNSRECLG